MDSEHKFWLRILFILIVWAGVVVYVLSGVMG